MSRNRTPKEVAEQFEESNWENSDASSDKDDDFFIPAEFSPLYIAANDHLELAEDSETEEDSQPTIQPQNGSSNSTGDTSATGSAFSDPIPFNEPVGPAIEMDSTSTPLDFFNVTFGNDIMELLVEQTNLYAEQNPPSARYKWYNTTISEMYLFLGIIIAMGVHRLPSFADYWSSDSLLGVPGISIGMPIDRFKAILRCLHVNDNTTAVPRGEEGYDRLHKLRPLIERLRNTWRTCYNPPREQSIDEAMVGFKGRNAMKQYMPMKPTKRGYKVWCRCSPNGLMSDCEIYGGSLAQTRETNLSSSVVLKLAGFMANKGHHLFFDNYFSSVGLCRDLLGMKTYSCEQHGRTGKNSLLP